MLDDSSLFSSPGLCHTSNFANSDSKNKTLVSYSCGSSVDDCEGEFEIRWFSYTFTDLFFS